jgi:hypothetical protein
VPKKERRLIELFKGLTLTSKLSSRVSTLFMADSLTLGFDVEVVNNDAVDLLIGFIWRLATPVASAAIGALVIFCGLSSSLALANNICIRIACYAAVVLVAIPTTANHPTAVSLRMLQIGIWFKT